MSINMMDEHRTNRHLPALTAVTFVKQCVSESAMCNWGCLVRVSRCGQPLRDSPCGFHAPRLAAASGQEVAIILSIATIIWWYKSYYLRLGTFNGWKIERCGRYNQYIQYTSFQCMYCLRDQNRIQGTERVSAIGPLLGTNCKQKQSCPTRKPKDEVFKSQRVFQVLRR